MQLHHLNNCFCDLEILIFRVAWNSYQETKHGDQNVTSLIQGSRFSGEILFDSRQNSLEERISLTNKVVKQGSLCGKQEQLNLLISVLQSRNSDMHVSNASFHESLSLLRVFALNQFVSFCSQSNYLEDQSLRDFIQVNEQTSGSG